MVTRKDVFKYSRDLSVLIVENNNEMRLSLLSGLVDLFKKVEIASNGQEGLDKISKYFQKTQKYFDLIITDVSMPVMGGMEMIEEIQKSHLDQKIIVISARYDVDLLINLLNLGIASYISKPLDYDKFNRILEKTSREIFNSDFYARYFDQISVINQGLEHQIDVQCDEIEKKDQFISKQSRLAQMGKMIDVIADQWKQPLAVISSINHTNELQISKVDTISDFQRINFTKYTKKIESQIQTLTDTLTEFRSFFKSETESSLIKIEQVISAITKLSNDELLKNSIKLNVLYDQNLEVRAISNELKHVIMNLIKNSIEAFNEREIKNRVIDLTAKSDDNTILITLSDNAGGISTDDINKVFEYNYSTKGPEGGEGIGLCLIKTIIEKVNGKISVENKNEGAHFTLILPNK